MKISRCVLVPALAVLFLGLAAGRSFAQQSNFTISPPPIPWFEFDEGQKDLRVSGTFFRIYGDISPSTGAEEEKLEFNGGAAAAVYRYAFRDIFAFDFGAVMGGGSGSLGSLADMDIFLASVPLDLEFQAVKTDRISLILFAGWNFAWNYVGIDAEVGVDTYELEMWSRLNGPQAGLQLSFKTESFVFTPFLIWQRMSGKADVDVTINGTLTTAEMTINSYTSVSYGLDIVYLPLSLTLSTIMQQVMEQGDNNPYNTIIFTISYNFKWEGAEKK